MIRNLSIRLASLFGRARRERELDAELAYHLDMQTEQLVRQGLARDAARREALRLFGPVDTVKDDVRDRWLSRFIEIGVQDVRYGVRSLRRNKGLALVIMLTMALGIGANSAIFSVVNGVLLRPLPYTDGDKLVVLHQGQGDPSDPNQDLGFSPKDLEDYRQARSLSGVVEFHNMFFNLIGREEAERLSTGVVSANYFDVLGVKPLLGRTFVAADDAPGAPPVLVLSHAYWERSFGGDPSVVGRVFRMNDKPHTVIGVLPDVPQYPLAVDIYMPSSACPFRSSPNVVNSRDGGRMLTAFARVNPEVTLSKSQADLGIVAAQLQQQYKDFYPRTDFKAVAVPLKEDLTRHFRTTMWILLGTAGFVLLIVCASIANLLLARMVRRERELSVRAALGATRGRLLRQLLTESVILALSGGLLGLALSAFSLKLLVTFAQRFTPRASEIVIDVNVLFFTLGVSIATGLIFGSIPAFARRYDVAPALREGGRNSHRAHRVRSVLIVAQVSASFMLLIGAGLSLRSLMKVQNVDPGFKTENLLTFRADMSFDKIPLTIPGPVQRQRRSLYWTEFEEKLKALPGVMSVGGGGTFPLNENNPFPNGFEREFHPLEPGQSRPQIAFRLATAHYFETLSQPLVSGRSFTAGDNAAPDATRVGIINQSAARHFWGNDNPIGTRIRGVPNQAGAPPGPWYTIVGVVGDVYQQLDQKAPLDEVYVAVRQVPQFGTTWVIHSRLPADALTQQIKAVARAHDPDLPVSNFRTLAEVRSTGLAPRRVIVALIGAFGVLALVITATGIAGVIAFSVNQRTQEFGIRMALGAQKGRVLALVVREGIVLVAAGLAIGLAGALVLTKAWGSLLSETSSLPAGPGNPQLTLVVNVLPTDVITYISVAATLVLVALAACAMPARRAASVDPMVALRAQ